MPMPEAKGALYLAELRDLACAECAMEAVRQLIRDVHFLPAIADILAEYDAIHRTAHIDDRRALPEERWTEEDERVAEVMFKKAMGSWRRKHGE